MTVKELKEISELDCSKSMDVNRSVIFSQAYTQFLVLG